MYKRSDYARIRRAACKIAAISFIHPESKVECERCGEDRLPLLQFHHKDPKQKDYTVARKVQMESWDSFVYELVKCASLCATCHIMEHSEELTTEQLCAAHEKAKTVVERQRKYYSPERMVELYHEGLNYVEIAKELGASFAIVHKVLTDLGFVAQKDARKKELLPQIIKLDRQGKNLSEISRALGVSDGSVGNWLKESSDKPFLHYKARRRIELMPKIKKLRAQGLSHKAIADDVGISPSAVGRWLKL